LSWGYQTLKLADGKVLFRTPCTREAFLYGMFSGGVVGTVGFLFKSNPAPTPPSYEVEK